MSNPVKYADLIKPDDTIKNLITELTTLKDVYSEAIEAIKKSAVDMQSQLKNTSGATSENRKKIDEAAAATSRLERAQKELKFALSDTGKQVAVLKSQTVEANKSTIEQARQIQAQLTSYNRLSSELKELVSLYKSLTDAERAEASMGGTVLQQIVAKRSAIAEMDSQMKVHVNTLTEVEKAEQRLAYLRSDEGRKLMELKQQISQVTAEYSKQSKIVSPLESAQERLAYARSDENRELKLYTTQIKEANQIAQLTSQINSSAEGSYNRLAAQYALNKIELNRMSAAEREAENSGKALEKQTMEIYTQMTKLQESTGNYKLSVGNYKKAWDGLGYSVTQVVRELPAAAVSLNTFFLGISNNIPMVVDEINNLRLKNKAMAAEGKETVSVTKSIVKSLLSWNTALVVVLMVLSMYGGQIIEFIGNLFKGEQAVLSFEEALGELNKELENNANGYGRNAVAVKRLAGEWKNLSSEKEQLEWIEKNKAEFDRLTFAILDVGDAENAFVDNTPMIIEAMKLRAKASAASELAAKKYEESLIAQQKAELEALKGPSTGDKLKSTFVRATMAASASETKQAAPIDPMSESLSAQSFNELRVSELEKEAKAAEAAGDAYFDLAAGFDAAADAALKAAGVELEYPKEDKGRKKREREGRDLTEMINRETLAVRTKYEESLTRLEQEEFVKRRKAALATYNSNTGALQNQFEKNKRILANEEGKYKELTDAQRKMVEEAQETIMKTMVTYAQERDQELERIEKERQIAEMELLKETLQLRLEAVRQGSKEELDLKIAALETERAIALASNSLKPVSEQVNSTVITESYSKQINTVTTEYDMSGFDEMQALEEARFNITKQTERAITRLKLTQEKERWEKQVALAKEGSLDWSKEQIEAAEATVQGIERQLKDLDSFMKNWAKNGLEHTLLELMGLDDDQIDALKTAVNVVIEQFGAILEAEVELAQKAVEAADERVDAAQRAYDAEVEARNNGYAANVASAKRELQQEKKQQAEKQKELEKAQRNQERLNTLTQASSLITASAQLWSSFSGIPIVGPALAIAAMAAMWGSFAFAKVKAKQVSASQEYGEGGFEILDGGSHASGNDIDLGAKNKRGKRMRAEGDEGLAIFSRKATRRYRRSLPSIVDSLNKGLFEEKYLAAFNDANEMFNMSFSNTGGDIDLSAIESDVRDIRRASSTRITSLGDGTIIKTRKNVTRIIKQS